MEMFVLKPLVVGKFVPSKQRRQSLIPSLTVHKVPLELKGYIYHVNL